MTEKIKNLIFKGIEKKEQILFKSFLNLAKNELDYQIVVLKDDGASGQEADVVITDDSYEFPDNELSLKALPMVTIGDDMSDERSGYLSRPVQWSDFRIALGAFSVELPEETQASEAQSSDAEDKVESVEKKPKLELVLDDEDTEEHIESEPDRVLPAEVMFAISDEPSESTDDDEADDGFDPIDHEYELDNMSIDYNSHTNSDYMKVVDDVQQFNVDGESGAMLLVTDDESNSTNSVLVIETNSLDAWDFGSEEEIEVHDATESAKEAVADIESVAFDDATSGGSKKVKQKSGFDLKPGEQYWLEDNEIIADEVSVLFIKHQREMVYSNSEPGKWIERLQGKKLSKLPMAPDWRPKKGHTPYPLSHLIWINSLVTDTKDLADGLDADTLYILEEWPHFDLLQLDNVLLKLCSMLFVNPESLNSLVEKSGYSRSSVRGLMNACYQGGTLKQATEVQVENLVAAENDSMFGKIKDVFR